MFVIFIGIVCVRGDYLKTMFIAVAIDINNQTLPTTFGVDVTNNVDSCTWFLIMLKEAPREVREVSFITNTDDVITSCIGQVFSDYYRGYCCKSVAMYMRTRVGGNTALEPLFWCTCKSYTIFDFQQTFPRLTPKTREVLANIGNVELARSYLPNICWNLLKLNLDIL